MKNLKIIQHWRRNLNKYVYWISINGQSINYGTITKINIKDNKVISLEITMVNNISITMYDFDNLSVSLKYIKSQFKQKRAALNNFLNISYMRN